jgi:sugar phosphate isomerase/epimerase
MFLMKIGFGLAGFFTMPLRDAIETISDVGYDGLEVYVWNDYIFDSSVLSPAHTPARLLEKKAGEIKNLTKEFGVRISALMCLDIDFGYRNACEETRLKHIQFTKQCIDIAADMEVGIVPFTTGPILEGLSSESSWVKLLDTVGTYVDYASKRDVIVALEPHAPFRGKEMLVDSVETCLKLLKAIDHKNLKVNFDQSHFSIRGWNISDAVQKLSKYIVHAHLKGSRGLYPKFEWYVPGEYPEDKDAIQDYALALKNIGYDGFMSVEVANSRRTQMLYDPKQAAKLAYDTVSSVLENLGLRESDPTTRRE